MLYVYALFALAVIPLINLNRREDSGHYILIFTSFAMGLWFMWHGTPIPWDPVTQATIGLSIFIASSIVWSTHFDNSIFDALSLVAGLFLFLTLRVVPAELSLTAVAVTASGIAVGLFTDSLPQLQILKVQMRKDDNGLPVLGSFFGNTNHTGFYCMSGLVASIYLYTNGIHPVMAMITLTICAIGMVVSKCRAAIIGSSCAMVFYGIHQQQWLAVGFMAVATALVVWQISRKHHVLWKASIGARAAFYIQALYLISKRPLFGWGLRTYRIHAPDTVRMIRRNKKWQALGKWYERKTHSSITHRVHCDPLEFAVETGLAGLAMVGCVAVTLTWEDPFLASAVTGFVVGSLFFFPFREAHLLPAMLAVLALMAPAGSGVQGPWIQVAVVLSIAGICVRYGRRFWAEVLWFLLKLESHKGKDNRKIYEYTMRALDLNPYSNRFLCFAYWFHHSVLRQPVVAFKMASRALENYDGSKIKHQMFDSYGKYALQIGTAAIARNAFNHALDIEPTNQPSIDGLKVLDQMQAKVNAQMKNLEKKRRKQNGKQSRHRKQRPHAARG